MRSRRKPQALILAALSIALLTALAPSATADPVAESDPVPHPTETVTRVGGDAFVATIHGDSTEAGTGIGAVELDRRAATSGFTLLPSVSRYSLRGYTIRLVDSPGIEGHRRSVEAAAGVIAAETGLALTVEGGTVPDRFDQPGEMLVRVSDSSACGPLNGGVVGCGGPSVFGGAIVSGDVTLAPQLECDSIAPSVVAHELGHAFGLDHYTEKVDGLLQVMFPNTSSKAPSFRAGDRAGLRAIAGRSALTNQAVPPSSAALTSFTTGPAGAPAADSSTPSPSHPVGAAVSGSLFSQPAVSRVLDTRLGIGLAGPFASGQTRTLSLAGWIGASPADAVVLNLTVAGTDGTGFVTAFPAGTTRPETSSANYVPGTDAANLVIVKLGAGNTVDLYNEGGRTDLVADLLGFFSGSGAAAFVPADPARIFDTRESAVPGESGLPLGCEDWEAVEAARLTAAGVPLATAVAEVVNLTAADTTAPGFVSFRPRNDFPLPGALPSTSNLNLGRNDTRANLAITPGREWLVQVSAELAGHVIVDLAGWFVPPATVASTRLVALDPLRVLDTRRGIGMVGRFSPSTTRRLTLPAAGGVSPEQIAAVIMNVTVVGPDAPGFLTAWPGGTPQPNASNVNYDRDEIVPNLVIVKVGAGASVDLQTSAGSPDVIADVMGYFVRP